jgi:GNAT superfamily N-acetyltransferase
VSLPFCKVNSSVRQMARISATRIELRTPTSDGDWAAYHAIRRRVLFELRGTGAVYDANHPDEHLPGNFPLILWDADVAVGVIRIDLQDGVATFRRVAVREDMQRHGYGRRLLRAAERFALEHGCTRVISHVDPSAVGFYERCGFAGKSLPNDGRAVPMSKQLTR